MKNNIFSIFSQKIQKKCLQWLDFMHPRSQYEKSGYSKDKKINFAKLVVCRSANSLELSDI